MNGTRLFRRVLAVAAVALLFGAEPPGLAEDDLLPAESHWKGTLTQRSKSSEGAYFPPELQAELTITRRDGTDFEGELREQSEGLDVTFLVRGKLLRGADKSYAVEFKSYAVKGVPTAAVYYVNVPYTARVSDGGLTGSWAYEDKEAEVALDGEFKLKRADE
ncbi:MAG: hypothetical protein ACJ8F7_18665 [Gemmataceae bacterium]